MTVPLEGKDSNIVISGNRWEYYNAKRYFCYSCYLVCVFRKLLKICFFNSRFVKEYLQGFSLSINLAARCKGVVLFCLLFSLNKSCMHNIINVWGYTEILHNLRFVSAVFLPSETFFFI